MQGGKPSSEDMFDPGIRVDTQCHEDGSASITAFGDGSFITGFDCITKRPERCHRSLQQHQPVPCW